MKTNELTGAALDWAVAKCDGVTEHSMGLWKLPILEACTSFQYSPSTNWAQGGPIIEREEIETRTAHSGGWMANRARTKGYFECGPTPLIAAMRCYGASKLGDNIDIPKELT